MKKSKYITGFLVVIVLLSCEKTINIKPVPYQSKLSVQCLISPGEVPKVYFYRTVPYFDVKQLAADLFIRNAVIKLNSAASNISFVVDSSYNIVKCDYDFYYRGSQAIQTAMTYTLNIQYAGDMLLAIATTNQRKPRIDSIGYTANFQDVYGGHEGVIVHFSDIPGIGDYYRYKMGRTIPDSITDAHGNLSACSIGSPHYIIETGRTVYTDKNTDGSDMSFVFEPAFLHSSGQVAYIQLQSVDKNIYDFYDQLDRQKLAQFNPFVEPVFLKAGQFGSKAIGVFGAYINSDSVRFVYPE